MAQGYLGECGLRGGYMEVHGVGAEVSFLSGTPAVNLLSVVVSYWCGECTVTAVRCACGKC